MPMVITSGVRNWTEDTPRLPSPALRPRADPLRSLGKKKLMLDMDDEKLPTPSPHRRASTNMVLYGVAGIFMAMPIPTVAISRLAVELAVQRRPPTPGTMKQTTMANVDTDTAGTAQVKERGDRH